MSTTLTTDGITRVRRERRILTRDGTALAVTQWRGKHTDHTVVFLHGLCLNHQTWDAHINHVLDSSDDRTQVIAYDHRGHGDSDSAPVGTYTVHQLAADLDDVLTILSVRGPVTLIGHSLGGMVALTYLDLSNGDRDTDRDVEVAGLVMCASSAGNLIEHGLGRLLSIPGIGALASAFGRSPDIAARAVTGPLCALVNKLGTRGGLQRRTLMAVAANALATTPLRTAVGYLPALRDFDQRHRLRIVSASVTIVSGGLDALTPAVHAELMAETIPGAVHVHLPHAGHMLPQMEPGAVALAIARTVASARPGPAAFTAAS